MSGTPKERRWTTGYRFERLVMIIVSNVKTHVQILNLKIWEKLHIFVHYHNRNLAIIFSTVSFLRNLAVSLIGLLGVTYETSQKVEMFPSEGLWRTAGLYKWYMLRKTLSINISECIRTMTIFTERKKLPTDTLTSRKMVNASLPRVCFINTKYVKERFLE